MYNASPLQTPEVLNVVSLSFLARIAFVESISMQYVLPLSTNEHPLHKVQATLATLLRHLHEPVTASQQANVQKLLGHLDIEADEAVEYTIHQIKLNPRNNAAALPPMLAAIMQQHYGNRAGLDRYEFPHGHNKPLLPMGYTDEFYETGRVVRDTPTPAEEPAPDPRLRLVYGLLRKYWHLSVESRNDTLVTYLHGAVEKATGTLQPEYYEKLIGLYGGQAKWSLENTLRAIYERFTKDGLPKSDGCYRPGWPELYVDVLVLIKGEDLKRAEREARNLAHVYTHTSKEEKEELEQGLQNLFIKVLSQSF